MTAAAATAIFIKGHHYGAFQNLAKYLRISFRRVSRIYACLIFVRELAESLRGNRLAGVLIVTRKAIKQALSLAN